MKEMEKLAVGQLWRSKLVPKTWLELQSLALPEQVAMAKLYSGRSFLAERDFAISQLAKDFSLESQPLEFIQAEPGDWHKVWQLMAEAADWLQARGIAQWTRMRTPQLESVVRERVEKGEQWVGLAQGQWQLCLALMESDPAVWGEQGKDQQALYVHGLVTPRALAGRHLGPRAMNFAERKARQLGKAWVRLDCMRDNLGLRAYYRGLGYQELGETRAWDFDLMKMAYSLQDSEPDATLGD